MKVYRQGDVLLISAKLPKGAEKQSMQAPIVLAYGEVTGHAHKIDERDAEYWTAGGERFIRVALGQVANLVHEEHSTIPLPSGTYRVVQQREYSPEEIRNVAD